jgi:peptide-methionine (S)-S-oxide reductase
MRLPMFLIAAAALAATGAAAPAAPSPAAQRATAVFAGGCFWCTESDFDHVPGVIDTTSGYTGGKGARPTYDQVSAGGTGHFEAVRVTYDPTKVSYSQLVRRFLRTVDVVDGGGQFCDRGPQYRSAIFVATTAEKVAAQTALRDAGIQLKQPIATSLLGATAFWPAEGYHQDYYKKNPVRYKFYRWNCGRDQRLSALWKR